MRSSQQRGNNTRKIASNVTAIVVTLSLVFMQTPIGYAVEAQNAGANQAPAAADTQTGAVDVALGFDHAYISYDGQVVAAPATMVTVPSGADFTFEAIADNGYEVSQVTLTTGGVARDLTASENGKYTVAASALTGDVSIEVLASPAQAEVDAVAQAVEEEQVEVITEQVEEQAAQRTEFEYSDTTVNVTAKLSEPGAVPANAEFVVTPVTPQTKGYNYDAYLKALNDADASDAYTADNTMLYDVAFMVPKVDANGNEVPGEFVEFEPAAGTVDIQVQFKQAQLNDGIEAVDEAGVEIKHLPLKPEVRETVDSTESATNIQASDIVVEDVKNPEAVVAEEKASFTLDSLSVISFRAASVASNDNALTINLTFKKSTGANAKTDPSATLNDGDLYFLVTGKVKNSGNQVFDGRAFVPVLASDVNNGVATVVVDKLGHNGQADGPFIEGETYNVSAFTTKNNKSHSSVYNDGKKYVNNVPDTNNDFAEIADGGVVGDGYVLNLSDGAFTYSNGKLELSAGKSKTASNDGITRYDAVDKSSQINYSTALGRAAEYGILAHTYEQNNHTETNWAVYNYIRNNDQITDPDLATNTDSTSTTAYPYLMSSMEHGIRFGNHVAGFIDIYLADTKANRTAEFIVDDAAKGNVTLRKFYRSKDVIDSDVRTMIEKITAESNRLAGKTTIEVPDSYFQSGHDRNNWVFDTTMYADDDVIYVKVPAGSLLERTIAKDAGSLIIKKKSDQVVVFNMENSGTVTLGEYRVQLPDGTMIKSDTTNSGNESTHNEDVDREMVTKVIWNMPNAEKVIIDTSAGLFLAPNASKNSGNGVLVTGSSAGWIATGGRATNNSAEWHFIHHARQYTAEGSIRFQARKEVQLVNEPKVMVGNEQRYQTAPVAAGQYFFTLYKTGEDYDINAAGVEVIADDVSNQANAAVQFPSLNITEEQFTNGATQLTNYYVIKEKIPKDAITLPSGARVYNGVTYWEGSLRIKVVADLVKAPVGSDGHDEIRFTVSSQKFDSDNTTVLSENTDVVATTQVFTFGALPNKLNEKKGELSVTKELVGRDWKDSDQFTFKLTAGHNDVAEGFATPMPEGSVKGVKTATATKANMIASFGQITYTEPGVYEYTIQEVVPANPEPGMTYDTKEHTVQVTVDGEEGDQKITVKYDLNETNNTYANGLTIKNTSTQTQELKGSVVLEANKQLTGAKLANGQFSFALKDSSGKLLQTKSNGENGAIAFDAINYTEEGTYNYKITEVIPEGSTDEDGDGMWYKDGMFYDGHAIAVSVEVVKDGNGLKATPTYKGETTFKNESTQVEGTSVAFEANKVFTGGGKTVADKSFSFQLIDPEGTVVQKKSSDSEGNVHFDAVDLNSTGTFTYQIKEVVPEDTEGITYDTHTAEATVTVSDVNGKLQASPVTYSNDPSKSATFTNTYRTNDTTATIQGEKKLVGRNFKEGDSITFEIAPAEGMPADTPLPNPASVTVSPTEGNLVDFSFNPITYKTGQAGTYTYVITETTSGMNSVQNDSGTHAVTVTVTDDGKGTLSATTAYSDGAKASFTNTYTTSDTTATIQGSKTIVGANGATTTKSVEAGKYSFQLLQGTQVLQTVSNDENGAFAFEPITYKQADAGKTFTYTVKEVAGQEAGVAYDASVYTVDVAVTDDGNGALSTNVTYRKGDAAADSAAFTNTYNASGTLDLNGKKRITGREFRGGDNADSFTFNLTSEPAGAPMPESASVTINPASGYEASFYFGTITYGLADVGKTYVYTIKEAAPAGNVANGLVFDTHEEKVTVTITDPNKNGKLKVDAVYDADGVSFTNDYRLSGTEITLGATKHVNGVAPAEGSQMFTFQLLENGKVIDTATNDANGNVTFKKIEYGEEGVHTYTICEDTTGAEKDGKGNLLRAGYTYDQHSEQVVVTVADDGNGNLSATADKSAAQVVFNNAYDAAGSVTLTASKTLNGAAPDADAFSFELVGPDGAVMQTVKNGEGGLVSFAPIQYTLADAGRDFTYTIREVAPNPVPQGYTYDNHSYVVTVHVTDLGNGTLGTEITKAEGSSAFVNTYNASGSVKLGGTKHITGRAFGEGGAQDSFTFKLAGKDGAPMPASDTVTVEPASGEAIGFEFGDIAFGLSDAGKTYTYTITEVVPSAAKDGVLDGLTYDAHEETVTVKLTDAGNGTINAIVTSDEDGVSFTNTYNAGDAKVGFKAHKTVNGSAPAANTPTFTFELSGPGIEGVRTVDADNAGTVDFGEVAFSAKGTYTYTIREVVPDPVPAGYTYVTDPKTVTVTVTDDGKGNLNAVADPVDTAITFDNTYVASGQAELSGVKSMDGKLLKGGDYRFELKRGDGQLIETVANAGSGAFAFAPIAYTLSDLTKVNEQGVRYDDFTYMVNEFVPTPEPNGYTYDKTVKTVNVHVQDNGDGTLAVSYGSEKGNIVAFANTYDASGSFVIEGSKTIANRTFKEGDSATFTLTGSDGAPMPEAREATITPTAGSSEDFAFGAIPFTLADVGKQYTYTITESSNNMAGTTLAEGTHTVTLAISDGGNGELVITPTYSDGAKALFTNTYDASGTASVEMSKSLANKALQKDMFTFVLKDAADNEVARTTNAADGTVKFENALSFGLKDAGKTYTYTVSELADEPLAGVSYAEPKTVNVTVSDHGTGKLDVNVSYPQDGAQFINTYSAGGQITLGATKELSGRDLAENQFGFELVDAEGTILQTARNDANGNVTFAEPLKYTIADAGKSFTYTIREVVPDPVPAGYTYDTDEEQVVVSVRDNGDGKLGVSANRRAADIKFTNSYSASGEVTLQANKELAGRALQDGQFTFELIDANGTVMQTKTNAADGTIAFDKIGFTSAGTYTYTIREVAGDAAGYTYASNTVTATVNVKDNGDGSLTATESYAPANATFANTYHATGSVELNGTKTLQGRAFKAGDEFTFTVVPTGANADKAPMPENNSVTINPTTGTTAPFSFGAMRFDETKAGQVFTYTVTESATIDGVTNDAARTVTLEVADNGNGTLTGTLAYAKGDESQDALAFVNAYAADGMFTLGGTKSITGREFIQGDTFTFNVTAPEGTPMPASTSATVTPTAGKSTAFSFGDIAYTQENAGKTYTYTVTESAEPAVAGVTYDKAVYTVDVTVSDNGDSTLSTSAVYHKGDAVVSGIEFVNAYHATGSLTVPVSKSLTGRTLDAGEFTFELTGDGITTPMTATVDEVGNATFGPIEFNETQVGNTYTYVVKEQNTGKDGVTYWTDSYTVKATVADNHDGTLSVNVVGVPEAGLSVPNTYKAEGELVLRAHKDLTGHELAAGQFTFELTGDGIDGAVTAVNDASGNVVFNEITVKEAGTHNYVITEQIPANAEKKGDNWYYNGYTYDGHQSKVTVVANDDRQGNLTFDVSYADGSVANFSNAYQAAGTYNLTATKKMEGRAFQQGDSFTFAVSSQDANAPMPANPVVTITPAAGDNTATVDFGAISFGLANAGKSYTYTVTETASNTRGGVEADPFGHSVTLLVQDKNNGELSVTETEFSDAAGGITLTNRYTATGSAQLSATKTLEGRSMKANEFNFTLQDGEDKIIQRASADASGNAKFAAISYDLDDVGKEFHYTIKEVDGGLPGVTYDTHKEDVIVKVSDNGDGTLGVTYNGQPQFAGAQFKNTYKAEATSIELAAQKILVGGTLAEGQFTFELLDSNNTVLQTKSNAANGVVTFDKIDYDAAGTYNYSIREVVPEGATRNSDGTYTGADGIIYDGAAHPVTVTVTDNVETGKLVAKASYDGQQALSIGNTALVRTGFEFKKHFFGGEAGNLEFAFTLQAANADGKIRTGNQTDYSNAATIVDDGTAAFKATVGNGAFANGVASVVFPEISFTADGDYYYLVSEDKSDTPNVATDEAQYLAHVKVANGAVAETTYELIYQGTNYGATNDLSFYNNGTVTLGFASLAVQSAYTDQAQKTSAYPEVKKYLNGTTERLVGGDFQFELVDAATGDVIATKSNDEAGKVAFFDENDSEGLVFTEPGEYRYIIREIKGDDPSVTYDSSEILLTVTVTQGERGLETSLVYSGAVARDEEPAFYNTVEGMDLTVQKVSRFGGEGLADCTYALWMVGENGDMLIQEATSDETGFIVFKDVNLMKGAKYYFKEVEAPKGHTVDPYRTAYFSLNEDGTKVVLVEETASDGWHSGNDNIELDGIKAQESSEGN